MTIRTSCYYLHYSDTLLLIEINHLNYNQLEAKTTLPSQWNVTNKSLPKKQTKWQSLEFSKQFGKIPINRSWCRSSLVLCKTWHTSSWSLSKTSLPVFRKSCRIPSLIVFCYLKESRALFLSFITSSYMGLEINGIKKWFDPEIWRKLLKWYGLLLFDTRWLFMTSNFWLNCLGIIYRPRTYYWWLQASQKIIAPHHSYPFPAGICLVKDNNRNTRKRCEICAKLTIKTPERRQWRCSGVVIVNFEHISHLVLVFLLLSLSRQTLAGLREGNVQGAKFMVSKLHN